MDMNLVCNTELTMPGQAGKCECRRDMKWNRQEGECQVQSGGRSRLRPQMYLDIDCSAITYDTPPSAGVMTAVTAAQAALAGQPAGQMVDPSSLGRTETYQESLQNSLLRQMDPQSNSEADLREAFCRSGDPTRIRENNPSQRSFIVVLQGH
jgi:hypothetical protein